MCIKGGFKHVHDAFQVVGQNTGSFSTNFIQLHIIRQSTGINQSNNQSHHFHSISMQRCNSFFHIPPMASNSNHHPTSFNHTHSVNSTNNVSTAYTNFHHYFYNPLSLSNFRLTKREYYIFRYL